MCWYISLSISWYAFQQSLWIIDPEVMCLRISGSNTSALRDGIGITNIFFICYSTLPKSHCPVINRPRLYFRRSKDPLTPLWKLNFGRIVWNFRRNSGRCSRVRATHRARLRAKFFYFYSGLKYSLPDVLQVFVRLSPRPFLPF